MMSEAYGAAYAGPLAQANHHYLQNIKLKKDAFLSAVALLILMPLLLIIGAAILITDGRPVLFVHERIGQHGKRFGCLKFRTMRRDADACLNRLLAIDADARAEWEATQKLTNDPRVVPVVGSFLRKTSFDELPQLINILTGDMSFVGPRPITAAELDRYGPYRESYLAVRPGLTGAWQVQKTAAPDLERRAAIDASYVERASLTYDVGILFRTVRYVVAGENG